jgi:type IV secretory pathway TraG/TraD family ATPase VirD4
MVLGVQDFSQLYEIYGSHLAKTIISGCQTKLLLRVTDGDAAKLLAKLMGEAEIDEKEETLSYGLNSQRDGVSVFARRSVRDIVLTSEILTLPDMTGYLALPGDYPIAKVSYDYVPTPKIAEAFVERQGLSICFDNEKVMEGSKEERASVDVKNQTDIATKPSNSLADAL